MALTIDALIELKVSENKAKREAKAQGTSAHTGPEPKLGRSALTPETAYVGDIANWSPSRMVMHTRELHCACCGKVEVLSGKIMFEYYNSHNPSAKWITAQMLYPKEINDRLPRATVALDQQTIPHCDRCFIAGLAPTEH